MVKKIIAFFCIIFLTACNNAAGVFQEGHELSVVLGIEEVESESGVVDFRVVYGNSLNPDFIEIIEETKVLVTVVSNDDQTNSEIVYEKILDNEFLLDETNRCSVTNSTLRSCGVQDFVSIDFNVLTYLNGYIELEFIVVSRNEYVDINGVTVIESVEIIENIVYYYKVVDDCIKFDKDRLE